MRRTRFFHVRSAARSAAHSTAPPAASGAVRAAVLLLALGFLVAAGVDEERNAARVEDELLVAAASDLRFAFAELGRRFERESGISVTFNFGSTGLLTQQIESGAPFDLFFSANRAYVDRLVEGGLAADEPWVYAIGYLAVVVPRGDSVPAPEALSEERFEALAIANPAHAPYGMAAAEALERLGLNEALEERLVYGENVLDAMRLVETGNADAGLVALAFLDATEGLDGRKVPATLHEPIEQTAVTIKGAANPEAARRFLEFVGGEVGREVLERYRFGLPGAAPE